MSGLSQISHTDIPVEIVIRTDTGNPNKKLTKHGSAVMLQVSAGQIRIS
jgi:hypothetical protein